MALETPPVAPQRGDRTTFSARTDAFLSWLVRIVPQLNMLISSITTLAAGGANSFAYVFDTPTADADPGAGKFRLNTATQNAATVLRVSTTAGNGGSIAAFLAALQTGTSNIKGSVRLQKAGEAASYLIFDITSIVAAAGYYNLSIVPRASSSASPLALADGVAVFFSAKGDRGDGGNTPTQAEMRAAIGTLPVDSGGTGATTAAQALANLGGAPKASPTFTGQVIVPEGTSAAPGLAFANDGAPDTGLFHETDGQFGIVCNTSVVWRFNPNQSTTYTKFGLDTSTKGAGYTSVELANTNGLNIALRGGGQNEYKTLRLSNGLMSIINSAYSAQIWSLADNGDMGISGAFTASTITSTSDERLKRNWEPLAADYVQQLAGLVMAGTFAWKSTGKRDMGVGAQSVAQFAPEAVVTDPETGTKAVNHGGFAAASVVELARYVVALEARIAALEAAR